MAQSCLGNHGQLEQGNIRQPKNLISKIRNPSTIKFCKIDITEHDDTKMVGSINIKPGMRWSSIEFAVLRDGLEAYPVPVFDVSTIFKPRSKILALADVEIPQLITAFSHSFHTYTCDANASTY